MRGAAGGAVVYIGVYGEGLGIQLGVGIGADGDAVLPGIENVAAVGRLDA